MKPISLKMSAFGPYKGIEVVDFNILNDAKLYLITGDTGSGKTTIFDAITFALYGSASGKHREIGSLRSQYAESSTKTYVEFIFENNGREYKVIRNPEYERPSLKGDKLTKEKADVTLYYDNEVLTGLKNVNSKIVDVLGITREQFSQIAMIAQGDFLKLLFADTKDRINIFRSLFNTSKYNVFQEKIKSLEIEAKNKYLKERDSILQYIDDINTSDENREKIEELIANNSITSIELILELVKEQIKNEDNNIKQLSLDIEKHEKRISVINTDIGKLEIVSNNVKLVNEAKDNIANNTDEFNGLVIKFSELKNSKEIIEQQKVELSKLIDKLKEQKEVEGIVKELSNEVTKIKYDITQKSKEISELESRNIEITKEIDELKDIDQIERLKANKTILSERLNNISNTKKEILELGKMGELLTTETQNYQATKESYDVLKNDFALLETNFYASQAAILAIDLKDDEPCPVCGSIVHPQKAKATKMTVVKEELDQSKEILEQKKIALDNKFNQCLKLKTNFSNMQNKLIELYGQEYSINIDNEYSTVYYELSINEQNISQMEKDIKHVSNISNEREKNNSELSLLIEGSNKLENDLAGKMVLLDEKSRQFSELSLVDETTINGLKNIINSFNKEYDEVKSRKEKLSQELEVSKSTINNLEPQVKDVKIDNIVNLNEALKTEIQYKNGCEEKLKHINFENQQNIDLVKKIDVNLSNITLTEKRHNLLKSMSDTANGKVSSKEKIMLETYVQMSYFDKVIEYANTRFMVMSEGQFELKRRVESNSRATQVGLDLDVIDHYNGKMRSVKSLSGGESFMASLALALGLSDEIQYSSGGINIESMFVDEGFGTLSEDALNNSIKILSSLTEGNKSIGIISHVSELKQKIDTQVFVSKDRANGSKIEIRS